MLRYQNTKYKKIEELVLQLVNFAIQIAIVQKN